MSTTARIGQRALGFRRNTVGGVAATVAILSPALIGGIGLGGEAGYWYLTQRKVQNAADVMAHGAAKRLTIGADQAGLEAIALYLAEQAQIPPTAANIEVNRPPVTGGFIEDNNAVEIIVTETVPRLFSAMYSNDPVPIQARAVATARSPGRGCVLALSETEDNAITISGTAAINLVNCEMISNGPNTSVNSGGASLTLSAACVRTAGSADLPALALLDCGTAVENANPTTDPFAAVPEPSAVGACHDSAVGDNLQPTVVTPFESHPSGLPSIRYCNGLNITGNVALSPGLYIIEGGDLRINANAVVTGAGVIFYMRDGVEARFNGTATLNLSPPAFGPYAGMLLFSSRDATDERHRINGNFASIMDGAFYAPSSHIEFTGSATTSFVGCTQIIGDTIDFAGDLSMFLHCLFPPAETIEVAGTAQIVE
ncbi:MAG: pilus assembly protein TadG-related protein [Pseudomonadota bacterium]